MPGSHAFITLVFAVARCATSLNKTLRKLDKYNVLNGDGASRRCRHETLEQAGRRVKTTRRGSPPALVSHAGNFLWILRGAFFRGVGVRCAWCAATGDVMRDVCCVWEAFCGVS